MAWTKAHLALLFFLFRSFFFLRVLTRFPYRDQFPVYSLTMPVSGNSSALMENIVAYHRKSGEVFSRSFAVAFGLLMAVVVVVVVVGVVVGGGGGMVVCAHSF